MPVRPAIEVDVGVRLPLEALPDLLSPEQIEALMGGIADSTSAITPPADPE